MTPKVRAPATSVVSRYTPPTPHTPATAAADTSNDAAVAAGTANDTTNSSTTNVGGVGLDSGGNSSGDLYNLGTAIAAAPINISGLPGKIAQQVIGYAAQHHMKIENANDLMTVLTHDTDVSTVTYLQNMLYYGGRYPSTASMSDVSTGFMDEATTDALKKMVITTAQSGAAFGDYLTHLANFGKATSDIAAAAGLGKTPVGIAHPNPVDADAALRDAAQNLLGHDLDAGDYARFRAFYDATSTAMERGAALAQTKAAAQQGVLDGDYGDPQALASAYQTLQQQPQADYRYTQGASSANAEHGQAVLQPQIDAANAQLAQDQAAAQTNYLDPLNAAKNNQVGSQPMFDYTDPGSASAAAKSYLNQTHPRDIAAHNVADQYATLLSILGGAG